MAKQTILEQFEDFGNRASCCYADDSCREWGTGDFLKAQAMTLYESNPGWQPKMREVAKGFLWDMDLEILLRSKR
jgi:hypothetical protein